MRTRVEEKRTIKAALWGIMLFAAVQLAESVFDFQVMDKDAFRTVFILLSSCCAAASFAIFSQGWLLFSHKLSRYRLYTAALFLCVAVVDLLQSLSLVGVSFFGYALSENDAMWLLVLSKLFFSVGILWIYSLKDSMVSLAHKSVVLTTSCLLMLLSATAFAVWQHALPLLANHGEINFLMKVLGLGILAACLGGMASIVYRGRKERAPSQLIIIRALIYVAIGQGLIISANHTYDINYLLGILCGSLSYYLMLKGVYRLTIEDPFREQQRIEAKMNYLAFHDDLTGLPNKRRLTQRLDKLMQGRGQTQTGIVVFNVNRFKTINDSLGHQAGDRLLQLVGDRLKRNLLPKEEVFSMGGDEFALIMPSLVSVESAMGRIRELLELFEKPVTIDDYDYHISLCAGMAVYPEDGDTAEQLIQHADTAVHHAKEFGIDVRHFVPSMQRKAKERLKLENDLRKALERSEFYLEYQPLVHLETTEIVGMEALLRWKHPKRGNVPPQEFIPLAEENGLIVPLGEWVLRTACQQNKRWQEAGYKPICVSINLSMRQFLQPQLADQIGQILSEIGLDPKYVELEITESMTFDKETAFEQLRRLKELGVFISIDDFGTGYSSLHYLKNMPIDRLKIDRSFVHEVMSDHNDAAIVSTITSMAHHLQLKVTAEGVENEEQLLFLREQRCHEGQGYYFSKPILPEVFEKTFLLQ
ncbi:putative bifunctional diguanylate cyclase/phosphodiesterase [Paenibacillus chibensis]|uniref:putative bifunctional diguanylate cyclase/phosphodiesterase n=1 Tax=Paenibacillus chibensis TaxID=59846 RepID=UPI000FD9BE59|nr:EAL domain-containing protein [Paenibacillus chibensis]MEC0368722.1 EAL domain-containing protein [Paenibacillus chibensis]